MHGARFYDEGTAQAQGMRKGVVLARRLVRRLLRPILFRLDAELQAMERRQDQLERELKAALALGWDHVAMARRIAALEDHLEAILSRRETPEPVDATSRSSIPYPAHDGKRAAS